MAKDVREAVTGGKRALEALEEAIPGFGGYKRKEIRREADKLLRERLAGMLKEVDGKIHGVYEDVVESKMTEHYELMNAVTAVMDKIIGKVETADYGYAGFFSAIKVKEDALDAVYDFDKALFADVTEMEEKVDKLGDEVGEESDDVAKVAKELRAAIADFDKKFDKRKDVMLRLE